MPSFGGKIERVSIFWQRSSASDSFELNPLKQRVLDELYQSFKHARLAWEVPIQRRFIYPLLWQERRW